MHTRQNKDHVETGCESKTETNGMDGVSRRETSDGVWSTYVMESPEPGSPKPYALTHESPSPQASPGTQE